MRTVSPASTSSVRAICSPVVRFSTTGFRHGPGIVIRTGAAISPAFRTTIVDPITANDAGNAIGNDAPPVGPAGGSGVASGSNRHGPGACGSPIPSCQALPWAGVRLLSAPQHKDLLGLRAEVEFLTLGESPVVKIIYRLRNLRPVEKRCRYGLAVVPALGSDPRSLVAWGEGIVRHAPPWPAGVMDQRWAAVTNEASGRTKMERVWAGGDIVTGAATVISAMGAGRVAASDIDRYLQDGGGTWWPEEAAKE